MAKIEGKCKEVMDKTEWVAMVTCGDNGPHRFKTSPGKLWSRAGMLHLWNR